MRRVLALVLVGVLVTTAGVLWPLHVHTYTDHDHPEHHHGPAAHSHRAETPSPPYNVARVEPCNPDQHQVRATFVSPAASARQQVEPVESIEPEEAFLPEKTETSASIADVRVHGPPVFAQAPPRAPPLIAPA